MKYAIKKTVLTGIFIAVVHLIAGAQPIHHTGKEIEGILIYQDLLDDEKYYYAPNKLELAFNADGSPKFKYLKMANSVLNNTGTGGTLKDLSLIQLSLVKPSISREKLQLIKPRISDKEDLQLVPIPIDKMEFTLFAGNGSDANRQVIGSHLNASDQTNDNDLWEEKSLMGRIKSGVVAFSKKRREEDDGRIS